MRWERAFLRRAFRQRGFSAASASAGGVSAGAAKRTRRKKGEGVTTGGALLSLKDLDKMHGQPPDTIRAKVTVKAEGSDRAVGSGVSGGAGRSQRNAIVREVMQKHGLSLPQASKYVKEHNLY